MWVWLLWACGGEPASVLPSAEDRAAVVAALKALPDEPDVAFRSCTEVKDPTSIADCITAVVQSAPRHPQAKAWCAGLPQEWQQHECAFVRAEYSNDPAACADAGKWADECRLHLWRNRVPKLLRDQPDMATAIEHCRKGMEADGLDPADPDLWEPVFWFYLGRGAEDSICDEQTGALQTACRNAVKERVEHNRTQPGAPK